MVPVCGWFASGAVARLHMHTCLPVIGTLTRLCLLGSWHSHGTVTWLYVHTGSWHSHGAVTQLYVHTGSWHGYRTVTWLYVHTGSWHSYRTVTWLYVHIRAYACILVDWCE